MFAEFFDGFGIVSRLSSLGIQRLVICEIRISVGLLCLFLDLTLLILKDLGHILKLKSINPYSIFKFFPTSHQGIRLDEFPIDFYHNFDSV
jgi:hypothetical protein